MPQTMTPPYTFYSVSGNYQNLRGDLALYNVLFVLPGRRSLTNAEARERFEKEVEETWRKENGLLRDWVFLWRGLLIRTIEIT
jgi:hypothetical protein